jgi:hypothetical protein
MAVLYRGGQIGFFNKDMALRHGLYTVAYFLGKFHITNYIFYFRCQVFDVKNLTSKPFPKDSFLHSWSQVWKEIGFANKSTEYFPFQEFYKRLLF